MCVKQLEEGRYEVENQYARAVSGGRNRPAQELCARGLSGGEPQVARHRRDSAERLGAAPEYAEFDAELRFGVGGYTAEESPSASADWSCRAEEAG